MTTETFQFDEVNRRFRLPSVCPNPECGRTVELVNLPEAVSWCRHCGRPYEVFRALADSSTEKDPRTAGPPAIFHRRPDSAYCTQTGERLDGYSLLDWSETGGGPGRSHSVDDPYGGLFGVPDPRVQPRLSPDSTLEHESILPEPDDDWVVNLAVVRGRVVVVTALGRIRIFDAESGLPTRDDAIDWTGEVSTSTESYEYQVRFTPAFRGTRMVITINRQAQFRELHPFLFAGDPADSRPVLVLPEDPTLFLGPPLAFEHRGASAFCLLQGRPTSSTIENATLRFFALDGAPLGSCEAPGIARPPVFDRVTGQLAWVTLTGAVATLATADLRAQSTVEPIVHRPAQALALSPDDRPLLIAAPAPQAPPRTELWVAHQVAGGGKLILYRCVLHDVLSRPEGSWYWDRQKEFDKLGALRGFAVGIGSGHHRRNAAGQMIGISTDRQVMLLNRGSTDTATHPIPYGSYDPPILSSAGLVARCTDERLYLDHQRTGWNDRKLHPRVPVLEVYDRPQGLVQYGRRIVHGQGLGLRSYLIELERED